jgi:uncharacterized protein DUF6884
MYRGQYFLACWNAAATLAEGNVYILSAKYGLLPPGKVIAPYDLTVGQPGAVTADEVRSQARDLGIAGRAVVALCSARYAQLCRAVWPAIDTPLAGLGIGQQLHVLAETRRAARLPAASRSAPSVTGDQARTERRSMNQRPAAQGTCILTGRAGESTDDCTTHDHMPEWPADGPAVEYEHGRHTRYRKPTLTSFKPATPGAPISARTDEIAAFAFSEPDGTTVQYAGTVTQDDLFRALLAAGLLQREVLWTDDRSRR